MKTIKYLLPALVLFAGVSCTKEIVEPSKDDVKDDVQEVIPTVQLELSASLVPSAGEPDAPTGAETKTSLNGVKTLWTPGDAIAVRKIFLDGSKSRWYKFTSEITEASAESTFSGTIADGEFKSLEAVYPFDAALVSDSEIKVSIPAIQDAKSGSFAEKASVAVGKSRDEAENVKSLLFDNIASAVKFRLIHDASSVEISSADADIAGVFVYSEEGSLTSSSDASRSVKVTGEMKAGETYYAIVAPGQYNISAAVSGVTVKSSSSAIEFIANAINNLGIIADANQLPNCYVVKPGETIQIPVYKAFEMWRSAAWSDDAGKSSAANATATAAVLTWQDEPGLFTNLDGDQFPLSSDARVREKFFTVTAAEGKSGNALVAIRFDGAIRWAIHLWVTDYDPSAAGSTETYNGLEFMDRNLGATTTVLTDPASFGCYYQACRPCPFPGPASAEASTSMKKIYTASGSETSVTTGNIWGNDQGQQIRRATKDPLLFVTSTAEPYSWITTDNSAVDSATDFWPGKNNRKKTAYDPCPSGWMLPVFNDGGKSPYSFWADNTSVLTKYPIAGRLKFNGTFDAIGSSTILWCGDPTGLKTCSAYINFNSDGSVKEYNADSNHSRGNAMPVRCVKIK